MKEIIEKITTLRQQEEEGAISKTDFYRKIDRAAARYWRYLQGTSTSEGWATGKIGRSDISMHR